MQSTQHFYIITHLNIFAFFFFFFGLWTYWIFPAVATLPNKEWKPKSIVKPSANGPGVIEAPAKSVSPPEDNPEALKKDRVQMQDDFSRMNLSENRNVIIAAHIRVSETDRCRLTFGTLGSELDTTAISVGATVNGVEEQTTEPSARLFSL